MEPGGDGVVARRDGVVVTLVRDRAAAAEAVAFLDAAGSEAVAPLVDEAERARLEGRAAGRAAGSGHRAALARGHGAVLGYVGVLCGQGVARGDVAVRAAGPVLGPALDGCLDAAEELARRGGADTLQVWLRRGEDDEVEQAGARGYALERRLAVLGRRVEAPPEPVRVPTGVTIRPYRPDRDDRAVVDVLAAAYEGTADGGWDLGRFRERRGYDWFDPADLLLAVDEDDDRPVALHWTKRRSPTVGEVYNLAVAPEAQGRGLGVALLVAGLRHLHGRGAREVLLWVDLANEPAAALYTSHGFGIRWQDVSLTRRLA